MWTSCLTSCISFANNIANDEGYEFHNKCKDWAAEGSKISRNDMPTSIVSYVHNIYNVYVQESVKRIRTSSTCTVPLTVAQQWRGIHSPEESCNSVKSHLNLRQRKITAEITYLMSFQQLKSSRLVTSTLAMYRIHQYLDLKLCKYA